MTQHSPELIVVGSINEDHFVHLDDFPLPGQTVLATDVSMSLGGKGSNQAIAAALLGIDVSFIGQVGDDAAGLMAREKLTAFGIDVQGISIDHSSSTGAAYIAVNSSGENTIIVHSGANWAVKPTTVETAVNLLISRNAKADSIILAQGELPPAAIDQAALGARARGVRFVLNLAPVTEVKTVTLSISDPLIVNEGEAVDLLSRAGGKGPFTGSGLDLATSLAERYSTSVVVTLGAAGAAVATNDEAWLQPVQVTTRVVDTTGAGDAFVGALVASLCRGGTLKEAVRIGVAAGSFAVAAEGTAGSYATAEQLSSLIGKTF